MGRIRRGAAALVSLAALAALALPSTAGAAPPDDTVWLCKPGLADNPCATDLSTTQLAPTGDVLGETPVRRKKPKVDCFYVYPTVSDDPGVNSDREAGPEERSIALYQAARYAEHCRVYAPLYRQITLEGIFSGEPIGAEERDLSYNDVVDAWKTYLRRYNNGRGVVLIGHSQGTYVLRQLIAERIDKRKGVRKRIVSAILLGGNVDGRGGRHLRRRLPEHPGLHGAIGRPAARSRSRPSTRRCRRTPASAAPARPCSCPPTPPVSTCSAATPPRCAPAPAASTWCSRASPSPPAARSEPGPRSSAPPSPPSRSTPPSSRSRTPTPASASRPTTPTSCRSRPLGGAPVLNAIPDATWGLHLVDANIALGNLIDVTKRQIAAYVKRSKR